MKTTSFIFHLLLIALPLPLSAESFEAAESRKAVEVLGGVPLSGPHYRIAPMAAGDGFQYVFKVRSDFGDYEVAGSRYLTPRLYEIQVLAALQEFTDSKVFLSAVKQSGIDTVMAPVRAVGKVYDAAANPEQTWESVKKAPQGVYALFQDVGSAVADGVAAAGGAVSGKRSASGSKAVGAAESKALGYIGYNKRAMRWYEEYSLDPYTDNQPLRDKIVRIAEIETAIGVGFHFVPGVPSIPGLGTVNKVLDDTKKLAVYADPEVMRSRHDEKLKAMQVPPEVRTAFLDNPAYTPTIHAQLIDALDRLHGVGEQRAFIRAASSAEGREGALFYRDTAIYLAAEYGRTKGFKEFIPLTRFAPVLASNGRAIIPMPFDYVTWNEVFGDRIDDAQNALLKDRRVKDIELRFAGGISLRCRAELTKLGVTAIEHVNM